MARGDCAAASSGRAGSIPEDYHVTLRFIGDVDIRTASEIAEHLDEVHRPPASIDSRAWPGSAATSRARSSPDQAEPRADGLQATGSAASAGSACRRRRATFSPMSRWRGCARLRRWRSPII